MIHLPVDRYDHAVTVGVTFGQNDLQPFLVFFFAVIAAAIQQLSKFPKILYGNGSKILADKIPFSPGIELEPHPLVRVHSSMS